MFTQSHLFLTRTKTLLLYSLAVLVRRTNISNGLFTESTTTTSVGKVDLLQ